MLRFLMLLAIIIGAVLLIKPELIDIAKDEMQMRARTNEIIEQQPPISIKQGISALQENYPEIEGWTFTGLTEDVGSLIYSVSDAKVFNVVTYKAEHDLKTLLQENKEKAVSVLCENDIILNLLAHDTIRSVYVQYYDRQGIDYGRSLIDNSDCRLWPFSMQRVLDKAF